MDINSLPVGSRCLVDANIFLYHLADSSNECTEFLNHVARREVEAYITTVIVAEALHRQMMTEAVSRGLVTAGQALKKLKADPTLIPRIIDYITQIEKLLKLPLHIVEVIEADIAASHALRRTHSLFVNDSLNLACAMRFGISDIITRDSDFNRVSGLTVWQPTDV